MFHLKLTTLKCSFLIMMFWWSVELITSGNADIDRANNLLLWPNKQLNVLIDKRSLNETEQQIIESSLNQIEHKTCVTIQRLQSDRVNPFDSKGTNFLYIFKSHNGINNKAPTIGLSTHGCAQKGRQSVILTDAAFRWPEIVLKYHLLRSLGVGNLIKPTEDQLTQLHQQALPLSQKINNSMEADHEQSKQLAAAGDEVQPAAAFFAFATGPIEDEQQQQQQQKCLSDEDLTSIKQSYDCPDYQNRLSVKPPPPPPTKTTEPPPGNAPPPTLAQVQPSSSSSSNSSSSSSSDTSQTGSRQTAKKLKNAEESLRQIISTVVQEKGAQIDNKLIEDAAKSIVHYLLAELEGEPMNPLVNPAIRQDGKRLENLFDSLDGGESSNSNNGKDSSLKSHQERSTKLLLMNEQKQNQNQNPLLLEPLNNSEGERRSMLLKLDPYHANDPQLRQANQMKLSQLNGSELSKSYDLLTMPQTYRLLNNNHQQQQQQQSPQSPTPQTQTKSQSLFDYDGINSQTQTQSQTQMKPGGGGGKTEMMISFEQTPTADVNNNNKNPIEALASSQVLKLCSCTCQTMSPSSPSPSPAPSTERPPYTFPTFQPTFRPPPATTTDYPDFTVYPTYPTYPTVPPQPSTTITNNSNSGLPPWPTSPSSSTFPPFWTLTDYPSIPSGTPTWPPIDPSLTATPATEQPWFTPTTSPPPFSPPPSSSTTQQKPTSDNGNDDDDDQTTTASPPPPTTNNSTTTTTTTNDSWPPSSSTTTTTTVAASPCDQVQWVKPNKTIYSSAKIVWDVDRANQNYFLCQAQLDGELIPGKTHGLSCKVSSQGKAYEMHQFQVLIKPESVNLAWVQKDSKSFGSKNLPVIGGYSKNNSTAANNFPGSKTQQQQQQLGNTIPAIGGGAVAVESLGDPYIVSRCLVRDENNVVITLIGYINRQNVGWYPFDDIQIECSQYDVLACVN